MSQNDNVHSGGMLPITFFMDDNDCNCFFTEEEQQAINIEISHYENLQAIVIEVLKIVQKRRGWVSDCDIVSIAKFLKISVSEVEGVATFYNQIFRQPVGRHIIRFCDSVVCYINRCHDLQLVFEDILGIKQGETSLDHRFTFLPVCCLGKCDQSPVIMIDEDVLPYISLDKIKTILEQYP